MMITELTDSRLSSLDPLACCYTSPLTGQFSPTESDALQTPFFNQKECPSAHVCDHGPSHDDFLSLPSSLLSDTHTSKAEISSFPVMPLEDYGSPTTIDFDAPFSIMNDSELSPSSLLLSNPSRTKRINPSPHVALRLDAIFYSPLFPSGHKLNPHFARHYQLGDELGSGGYGFVMTAQHRTGGQEVAVKFIIKSKVPDHAWMEDDSIGRLPTEVMLLSFIEHDNIVQCLDLFEDSLYFYLVQELHGSPWPKYKRNYSPSLLGSSSSASLTPSTPALSPSASTSSLPNSAGSSPVIPSNQLDPSHLFHSNTTPSTPTFSPATSLAVTSPQPEYTRRPSHDLFECIEQSEHKRLSENQACYVFSQVVDAVNYLDSQGVTHRDIKDENLVIDRSLTVKLIDFGSAAVVDPTESRPYYTQFYGTTAYASPEILLKKEYQAPPAEIWTLGVLLSYLLTGTSPFPTVKDAINGRIVLADIPGARLSRSVMSLMRRCLDPNPQTRATIAEVKAHRWLAKLSYSSR